MTGRLFLVRTELSVPTWELIDRSGSLIVCASSALRGRDDALVERMIDRRSMLIVCVDDDSSAVTRVALISDLFAIRESGRIAIDHDDPIGMAGLVWRIGRAAIPLLAMNEGPIPGEELVRTGVADLLVPEGSDPLEWIRSWLGSRSLAALTSAARLVRSRGGEDAERAEFARLFAAGIPHEGLSAFLERREARFEDELIVETI